MASFLYACTNGCGRVLRFMHPLEDPAVVCESCVVAIADNQATEKKLREKREAAISARGDSVPSGRRGRRRGR